VSTANPGRPNTAFEAFVRAVAEHVGVALELPYEILIKHFTASYSAARAAMLEAWRFFKKSRVWLAGSFCQPVYEEFLYECVARGLLSAPGFLDDPFIRRAYCLTTWSGIPMGHIQPAQEATAARERIDAGITNREQEIADYNGGDWEDTHAQAVREKKARKKDGLEQATMKPAAPALPAPMDNPDDAPDQPEEN
jgi:capsid protein